jgi:hypothetical protein
VITAKARLLKYIFFSFYVILLCSILQSFFLAGGQFADMNTLRALVLALLEVTLFNNVRAHKCRDKTSTEIVGMDFKPGND